MPDNITLLKTDPNRIANLQRDVLDLVKENDNLRFELGLERLGFDNGQFETFVDDTKIGNSLNAQFTLGGPGAAQGFAFIERFIDIDAVWSNGEQHEYEVASNEDVQDATMTMTGQDSTSSESRTIAELSDGETVSWSVNGSEPVALEVALTGLKGFNESNIPEIDDSPLTTSNGVTAVAWDPSAEYLAAGMYGGNVRVWSTSDWSEISASPLSPQSSDNIQSVTWSPSGDRLAAGVGNGNIRVWSTSDWSEISTSPISAGSNAKYVDWSPSGDRLAVGLSTDNEVRVWSTSDWSEISASPLTDPTGIVEGVEWSPSGDYLAAGTRDNQIRVWSTSDWSEISASPLTAPSGNVRYVSWAPSGDYLAGSDGYDTTNYIRVWSTSDWSEISASPINTGDTMRDLEYHPSGDYIAVASGDRTLVFSTSDWSEISASPLSESANNYVHGLAWDPDGTNIASGLEENEIKVRDAGGVGTEDPTFEVDGQTVSYSGELGEGQTHTGTINDPELDPGSYIGDLSVNGSVSVTLNWTEKTQTINPSVNISSGDGTQTVGGSSVGTLADGSTVDLSNEIDESRIGGTTTITATVSDQVTEPVGQVGIDFTAAPNIGEVTHVQEDLGFVPAEIVINDTVDGDASSVTYRVEDDAGNTVTIDRSQVDTIVDASALTSSVVSVTAVIDAIGPELHEWGAYMTEGN